MGVEDPQALYQKTLSLHEKGELDEAARGYVSLLELYPDGDLLLYNYGLLEYSRGCYEQAAELFSRAVTVCPESVDYHYNLGLALKQAGRFEEAEQAYLEATRIAPHDLDVQYNLAGCYKDSGRIAEAIHWYEKVLGRDGNHAAAMNNLAYLYQRLGEYEQARVWYRRLLGLRPDDAGVQYMLASLEGSSLAAPPREYISTLFDQYAASFDKELVDSLEYRVPGLLRELFLRYEARKSGYDRLLDLGCGTGLAGELFRPFCRLMAGVDLSANMIAQARKKGIYDELAVADILEYLTGTCHRFDLLVAADVLTYLGDLAPFFVAVSAVATPGTLFAFSTEHGEGDGYRVQPTGRFVHDPGYICSLAKENDWHLVHRQDARLRRERNQWIRGDLYLLCRR